MDEERIERAVKFIEALKEEFRKQYCKDCRKKELVDCLQSDSDLARCIIGIIMVNNAVITGFFNAVQKLSEE